MRPWQEATSGRDRPDVGDAAAVAADAVLENDAAHDAALEVLPSKVQLQQQTVYV